MVLLLNTFDIRQKNNLVKTNHGGDLKKSFTYNRNITKH